MKLRLSIQWFVSISKAEKFKEFRTLSLDNLSCDFLVNKTIQDVLKYFIYTAVCKNSIANFFHFCEMKIVKQEFPFSSKVFRMIHSKII